MGRKLIIFDVDNTLIDGHLMQQFVLRMLAARPELIIPCAPLFVQAARLLFLDLPRALRTNFTQRDFTQLDADLQKLARRFYAAFFGALDRVGMTKREFVQLARQIFSSARLQALVDKQGIACLCNHLHERDVYVVLASGSCQEFVELLRAWLIASCAGDGFNPDRIIALGTQRNWKSKQIDVCVGSAKLSILERELALRGLPAQLPVTYAYSDNQFFADLPLLQHAEHGVIVHAVRSRLYEYLPKELLEALCFNPAWGR